MMELKLEKGGQVEKGPQRWWTSSASHVSLQNKSNRKQEKGKTKWESLKYNRRTSRRKGGQKKNSGGRWEERSEVKVEKKKEQREITPSSRGTPRSR